MQGKPLVSVIMPIFNTEKYVAEAIDSVLAQTYAHTELICVDDGSTDGTLAILRSYGDRLTVIESPENGGIGSARNLGLAKASGEFISFIDADDVWKPEKLELQLAALLKDPSVSMCFTHMECFLSPELPEEVRRIRYCPEGTSPGIIAGTSLIKREVAKRVGPYNELLRVGEFIDWNTRAIDAGFKSVVLPEVLYRRRVHETNTGVNERPSRADYLKVVRSALERRKKQ